MLGEVEVGFDEYLGDEEDVEYFVVFVIRVLVCFWGVGDVFGEDVVEVEELFGEGVICVGEVKGCEGDGVDVGWVGEGGEVG